MYFIPFIVGIGFQRARGQTWTSAIATSSAVVWTSAQIRKGAIKRVALMGHRVASMSMYNVAAGLALGAAGGIAVSQLLFGDEGRKDVIDLYTGKVTAREYVETIAKAPSRIIERTSLNRAVEGNAAGLPTGSPVNNTYTAPGHDKFHSDAVGVDEVYWS